MRAQHRATAGLLPQPGDPTASLTRVGLSRADLTDGPLSVLFGTDPWSGSAYMYVYEYS